MADGGVGEAALATEVMGAGETATAASALTPEVLGATGAMGAAGGLGGLSSVGSLAGTPLAGSGLAGLASAAPEAAAQTMAAQQAAAVGANQLAAAAPTISGASQLAAAGAPFEIAPEELQAAQGVVSSGAPAAETTTQEAIRNQIMSNPVSQMGTGQFTDSLANAAASGDPLGVSSGALGTYPPGTSDIVGGGVPMPAAASTANGLSDLVSKFHNLPVEKQMLYGGAGLLGANALFGPKAGGVPAQQKYSGPLSKFHYDPAYYTPTTAQQPTPYYQPTYQNYRSYADGGMMDAGANPGMQMQGGNDPLAFQSTGVERFADGGISNLGGYSDGGRMLKGPGDGMSDDIPATIADKQPARLANDEFVVPADVVSHLGNGSSDAGAKQLYKMMDRVRQARTGNKAQGKQINPTKYTPA